MAIDKKKMLTIGQAAVLSGMYPQTLRRLCKKGQLEGAIQKESPFGSSYWLIPEITMLRWKPRPQAGPKGPRKVKPKPKKLVKLLDKAKKK